jgi:hypothetical protein
VNIHHGTDVDFSSDENWSGTEVITFSVTDGTETATDDVMVIVTPAGGDLSIDLPDSFTFMEGETITVSFAQYITNNTGNDITLTCTGNTHIIVNIHHGTDVDFSNEENWIVTEEITFSVTDGTETASDNVSVNVIPAGIELMINLPVAITFERWTTLDVDFNNYIINNTGNELSLSYSGNDNVLITVLDNFIVHLEGEPFWEGSEEVTFTITDGQEASFDTVTIIITPEPGDISLNLPDVIEMLTNTIREEDMGSYVQSLYIYEFSWIAPENLLVEMDDMNYAFFSVIVPDWSGSEDITFTVTDYYGNTATDTVTLEVLPVTVLDLDLPSTFNIVHDQFTTRNLAGFVNEQDVTFSVEDTENIAVTFTGDVMSLNPDPGWTGGEIISIIAENSSGVASTDAVNVIVNPDYDNTAAYMGGSYDGFDFATGTASAFYTLSGVVVDSVTIERIAGALITVGEFETTTNLTGEYSIILESGNYNITCSAEDYNSHIVTDYLLDSDSVLNFQLSSSVASDDIFGLVTELRSNYPNPFNPETTIHYSVAQKLPVTLEIFNLKGQKIRTLVREVKEAGNYSVIWDGRDVYSRQAASGIYLYKMTSGGFVNTRKMILMK